MKLKKFDLIFWMIVCGVILLAFGIYLMGSGVERQVGRALIICGSSFLYIGTIALVFVI